LESIITVQERNRKWKRGILKSSVLKAVLLFVTVTVLIQGFYTVENKTSLFQTGQYFPLGYIVHVFYYLAILAMTFLFLGKISLAELGLKRIAGWKRYLMVGVALALVGFLLRVLLVRGTFGSSPYPVPYYLLVPAFVFLGLLIGLAEESAFRGFILGTFLEKHKPLRAILFSSFLFGVYHVNFLGLSLYNSVFWTLYVVQAFTGGIIMALLYYKTGGNLLGSVAYHSTNIIGGQVVLWASIANVTYLLGVETVINLALALLYFPAHKRRNSEGKT
jgi:membrane protease YdiL (CAAX protease family)